MGFLKGNMKLVLGLIGGAYIAQNYDVPNIKDEVLKTYERVGGNYTKPNARTPQETSSTNPEPTRANSS